jgi:hypothetical protein
VKPDEQKPEPKAEGSMPPPRPPRGPIVGVGPEDDDDAEKRRRKETVRINLPPKPSGAPTIKLPTLPGGTVNPEDKPKS